MIPTGNKRKNGSERNGEETFHPSSIPSHTSLLCPFWLCPVGWGCRIHRLLLCRGVRPPPNECPGYDTKQSDGEVPAPGWSFGECGVPLYYYRSQVHSGPEL